MRRGFTLIELLIVMSIIAALMAVATPVGVNAVAQAKATNVAGNFRTLQQAVIQMITLEPTPPKSGDILEYLYTKGYISTKPIGFEVGYETNEKAYIIRYTQSDVDVVKVKNIFSAVEINSSGGLVLRIPAP
ncbi:prepilin-type N-terminal cleavage/methylation domain-containing protein [Fervidobacterium changbaicum]|uniref:Type II secretion system GspH family protein n=2 Tax=Fervidobacterium TaxID=2422 RepID=A0AAI8CMK5_FERIS|nr:MULTISPECIES: type II secretion system protein [Fervidobacterium]AMW33172.1 type II secretion system GspH family protein [Fervidobacterium islandicum]QAV33234.1 type II secretion system protein [Fervidobacterium changbaicum]SDH75999.1 prepilin-type N-terminal cleavage/methylation domain-containing protein [Fervidobacterium changbaicum]